MILRLVRRFTTRFRGINRVEVLAIGLQAPLLVLALVIALLGREFATWAIIGFFAEAVLVFVALLVLEASRARVDAEPSLEGLVNVVIGATPDTEGWGVLAGRPGARRTLVEGIAHSLSLRHLTAFVMQNDSEIVYDAISLTATGGRFDAAALAELGRDLGGADALRIEAVLGSVDVDAVVALARAMHAQAHPGLDGVLEVAFSRRTPDRGEAMVALAQVLLHVGRTDAATAVLAQIPDANWDRDRLLSDLINPFTAGSVASVGSWLATVNQMYLAAGLEPLHLDADSEVAPFDRIRVDAPVGGVDGPLVSVIMSTYQPGLESLSAARSILAQTWQSLELLVMDDASGPGYDGILDAIAALDERVTVVRADVNAGTYVRRNDALRIARGAYVTIQDSDDWSHPRRLELQVRHLETHAETPANVLSTIRVSPQLRFTQPRGTGLRLAEPSLMFRRELVLDRIGYFDGVRRAADSEFRTRIERAFNLAVPRLKISAPLMLQRFDAVSLSGEDFRAGWTHAARFAYRSAYLAWQRRELREGRIPRMEFEQATRPFPAPARISGAQQEARHFRLVVAGDGRDTIDGEAARIEAALRTSGLAPQSFAFLHLPSLRATIPNVLEAGLQDVLNDGLCAELTLADEANVDLLVIAHADAVLGLGRTAGQIRAARVIVLADSGLELKQGGLGYAVPHIEELCRQHFGVTPEIHERRRHDDIGLVELVSESAKPRLRR